MAQHTVKPHRQERNVDQPRGRKSARISSAQEVVHRYAPKEAPPIQRQIRHSPNSKAVQNQSNASAKRTVSAAGIFKRKPKGTAREKKHHRRRGVKEQTPEPELLDYFRGTMLKPVRSTRLT
jgi:hypothetical protein